MKSSASKLKLSLLGLSLFGLLIACGPTNSSTENSFNNARSGKDKVADIIVNHLKNKKVKKLSYAYYLKQYVKNISNWKGLEEDKPRELLQTIGIDLIKNKVNNKLLINRVIEDIEVYSYFYDVIVITDARLVEEVVDIKNNYNGVITIRINRNIDNDLTISEKNHITETNLDNYKFDYIIENNDDYENLEKSVNKIVEELDNE